MVQARGTDPGVRGRARRSTGSTSTSRRCRCMPWSGLNGAGKSTLMRLLVGLLDRMRAGRAVGSTGLAGAGCRPGPDRLRRRLPRSYAELTVTEHLPWSARLHGCRRRDAKRRADDMIDRLALGRWASKPTRTLSSGNRQRLAVAIGAGPRPRPVDLGRADQCARPGRVIELRRIIADRARRVPRCSSPVTTWTRWPGWPRPSA